MRNASYMLALIGMLIQLAAAAAWWNIFRQPVAKPAAGRLEYNTRSANLAAVASVTAFGICAVAAIFAIVGWL